MKCCLVLMAAVDSKVEYVQVGTYQAPMLRDQRQELERLSHPESVRPGFSPDGEWLQRRLGTTGNGAAYYEAATGEKVTSRSDEYCHLSAFSPDGRWLVSGGATVRRTSGYYAKYLITAAVRADRNLTREWDSTCVNLIVHLP